MNGEQTVLVTGGSGFLGGWSVVEALRAGYRVRTTVRNSSREPQVRADIATQLDAGDRLEVVQADLLSDDGWSQAVPAAASCCTSPRRFPRRSRRTPTS